LNIENAAVYFPCICDGRIYFAHKKNLGLLDHEDEVTVIHETSRTTCAMQFHPSENESSAVPLWDPKISL